MQHAVTRLRALMVVGMILLLGVGCAGKPEVMPQETFWIDLSALCGKAYPGRVVVDSTSSPTFRDRPLSLYFARCDENTIKMPLLVGGQPWVTLTVSRVDGHLRLKHTHEVRDDGTSPPSGYGGDTRGTGTEVAQDFYADEFTAQLDEAAGDTVWTIEVRSGAVMSYGLRREGSNRVFRAVFDLSRGRPAPTVLPKSLRLEQPSRSPRSD